MNNLVDGGVVNLVDVAEVHVHVMRGLELKLVSFIACQGTHLTDVLLSQLGLGVVFAVTLATTEITTGLEHPTLIGRLDGSLDLASSRNLTDLSRVLDWCSDHDLIATTGSHQGHDTVLDLDLGTVVLGDVEELNLMESEGAHGRKCSVRLGLTRDLTTITTSR